MQEGGVGNRCDGDNGDGGCDWVKAPIFTQPSFDEVSFKSSYRLCNQSRYLGRWVEAWIGIGTCQSIAEVTWKKKGNGRSCYACIVC